jgi:hypothetical protein
MCPQDPSFLLYLSTHLHKNEYPNIICASLHNSLSTPLYITIEFVLISSQSFDSNDDFSIQKLTSFKHL